MDSFWEIVKLDLLFSIPQTFIGFWFCFSFLAEQPPRLIRRLLMMSALLSIYTDSLVMILPFHLHLLNAISAGALLLIFLFRDLKLSKRIALFIAAYLTIMLEDLISSLFLMLFTDIKDRHEMMTTGLAYMISVYYPVFLVVMIAAWRIRKGKFFSIQRLFGMLSDGNHSGLVKVILLILSQFALLGVMYFYYFSIPNRSEYPAIPFLFFCTLFISMTALVYIVRLIVRSRDQAVRLTQDVYIEDINRMFTSIRGQRHDFINHVQVIHTMLQLNKTDELKKYVAELVSDIRDVASVFSNRSPALAAFIQAKMAQAVSQEIRFSYELPEHWEIEPSVKSIDIVKMLGNLVNNAFDEVMTLPGPERNVHLSIAINGQQVEMSVCNSGRVLSKDEQKRILLPNYTTKSSEHSGIGLTIVQERVQYYAGKLVIRSSQETGTVFQIILPLQTAGA